MKRVFWISCVFALATAIVAVVSGQLPSDFFPDSDPDVPGPTLPERLDKAYLFVRGATDMTRQLADSGTPIKPRFRAQVDDRFEYDIDIDVTRGGSVTEDGRVVESFYRTEHWGTGLSLHVQEDELEGRRDLRMALRYDRLDFLIDNGRGRYSGYIGPPRGEATARFRAILPDGTREEVNNIPGWSGVTARDINDKRQNQADGNRASAWFSVASTGRVHNEAYFADFGSRPEQRNFPGRFQDPMHLALALFPEFTEDLELKPGETVTVRRRFPVSPVHGGAIEYDVVYTLDSVWGDRGEPRSARFSFRATPVTREHETASRGVFARFTAPDIEGGSLLFDLVKGVPAHVEWSYDVKGMIPGEGSSAGFEVNARFIASMRRQQDEAD